MKTKTKWGIGIGVAAVILLAVVFGAPQLYQGKFAPLQLANVKKTVNPSWAWKLAPDPDDAYNFINGFGAYNTPHAFGTITATERGFYIFYRSDLVGTSDWGWKLAPNPDDAYDFLNGIRAYTVPVKEAHVATVSGTNFYIFYRR